MTKSELAALQSAAQQWVHLSLPLSSPARVGGLGSRTAQPSECQRQAKEGRGGRQQTEVGSSCPGNAVAQLGSVLRKSTREGHGRTAMRAEAVQESLERQSRSNPQLHSRIKHLLPLRNTSGTPRGAEGAHAPCWPGRSAAVTSLLPPTPASSRASTAKATAIPQPRAHCARGEDRQG